VGGGNNKAVQDIRGKQSRTITNLTNVFKQKFRFKQKPKFKSNREDGTLNARDLWQIPNGLSQRIFEERMKNLDSKVQVAVALDISGSMDKEETQYGEKMREVAVVLSDALTATHVKHEVIGFGAPCNPDMQDGKANPNLYNRTMHSLETVVYRKLTGESGLGNIQIQPWDNSDGESVRVIAKRMLKDKKKKKILFIVSDNKPFLTDSDIAILDQDLRDAIKWCAKKGIDVYGIGWNKQGKDFYGDKYCTVEQGVEDVVRFMDKKLAQVR
jgi:cobaltochelatase CobT